LEKELAAYREILPADSDLLERPRFIVLNKTDVPEAHDLAGFVIDELKEKFGWPIFIISTVARKGLDPLRYALMEAVNKRRQAEPKRKRVDTVLVKPQCNETKVERDGEGWLVTGDKVERWVLQTDFENDEAVGYLGDRFAKAGVEELLYKAGAKAGDPVTIGGITFEWDPLTAAGIDPVLTGRGTDIRLEQTGRASAAERKRASQVRRGLIEAEDYGQEADTERWEG